MCYLGGGIGHVGTGAEVEITFNNGDFTWKDVNLEAAKLFESSNDEDATVVGAEKAALAEPSSTGNVMAEERIMQLAQDLLISHSSLTEIGRHGDAVSEPDHSEDDKNTSEDGEYIEEDNHDADDRRDQEDEKDKEDKDKHAQEGYADN